jgi:hypothetical protein
MDLMQLAQASNPGQALPGMEWDQIRRYQNLNTINQGALQQAIPVAQSNAQKELQANEEWNLAAPGRRDNITLGNMNAAQGVKDFQPNQAMKKLEMALKDQKLRAEIQDFTKPLASFGDAFINAKPEEQEAMLDELARNGMTLPDGTRFGVDREKDRFMLKMTGDARKGDAKLQNKLAVTDKQVAGKVATAALNQTHADLRNAANIQARTKMAEIAAANKQGKPLTPEQQALVIAFGDGKEITDQEGAARVLEYEIIKRQAPGMPKLQQGAGAANSVLSGGGLQVPTPEFSKPPAPITSGGSSTAPAKTQTKPNKPKEFKFDSIYTDSETGAKAKYKGKDANGKDKWERVEIK